MIHTNRERRMRVVERPEVSFPMPPCALAVALTKLGTGSSREKAARAFFRSHGAWPTEQPDWRAVSKVAVQPRIEPPLFPAPGSMRG